MRLQCNIDQSGRLARMIFGGTLLAVAVLLFIGWWCGLVSGWWMWPSLIFLLISGVFLVFEGMKGWCAVRALGIRTWI